MNESTAPPRFGLATASAIRPAKAPSNKDPIPIDNSYAAAATVACILGHELTTEAIDEMSEANRNLMDMRPEALHAHLARQLVILNALFMRLAKDAMATGNPTAKAALMKVGLQAHREARSVMDAMRELEKQMPTPDVIDER